MCKSSSESLNHLLIPCSVAQELWNLILLLFGTSWVMPSGVVDLLSCWSGRWVKSEGGKIWKAILHCLMWCLWCESNERTFNGKETCIPALKFNFLQDLFNWLKESQQITSTSLSEMLVLCSAYT